MGDLASPARIGVWERDHRGDRYERQPGDWHRWADITGFSRLPEGRRVLFLGESAARGFFYDPLVTPALLIEQGLRACGPERVEVIDLARVGARTPDILGVAGLARDLAPDVVAVLAGNNWKYELSDLASPRTRGDEARALAEDGVAGILRQREAALAGIARHFVEQVCSIFDGVAPVVFVVPESNLRDWHLERLAPKLGSGRDATWQSLTGKLRRAARAEDDDGVLECCEALHHLDGGVSDEAFRYKAAIQLRRGEIKQALASYRRARDVRLWYDIVDLAWLPSAGADAARTAAADCGARVVDLRDALPSHAVSGIPDRSLFLDQCHFNSRGLRIVAAEVLCQVAPLLGLSVPSQECAGIIPETDPEAEGGAQFCAAVAHAEFGQPAESIAFHAQAAIKAAPEIIQAMEMHYAAPAGQAPWGMRPREWSDLANVRRFVYGFGFVGRYRYNFPLVDAFMAQICQVRGEHGGNARVRRDRALVPGRPTELLDPVFASAWCPAGWDGLFAIHGAQRHYYRAYGDTTRLTFEVADVASLDLEITARLGTRGTGAADIVLNGHLAGSIVLTDRWQCAGFSVDPGAVSVGRNRLEIRWKRDELEPTPFTVLAKRIEQGLPQELGVTFGEVFSARASVRLPGDTSSALA